MLFQNRPDIVFLHYIPSSLFLGRIIKELFEGGSVDSYFIALGFFKNYDGSSDIHSVKILGLFTEERLAQQACVLYLRSIMVQVFTDRLDDEPNYAQEWLNKIEALQTIEVPEQLSGMWDITEEVYRGGFGPEVRIERHLVK